MYCTIYREPPTANAGVTIKHKKERGGDNSEILIATTSASGGLSTRRGKKKNDRYRYEISYGLRGRPVKECEIGKI